MTDGSNSLSGYLLRGDTLELPEFSIILACMIE